MIDHTPERETLRALLHRWQAGELTPIRVLVAAERLWEQDQQFGQPAAPTYARSDPHSIFYAVLWLLEALHVQPVTPDDIPAILAFLDTPAGSEESGWQQWDGYWDGIDLTARLTGFGDVGAYLEGRPTPDGGAGR
jgi:hypothetical protein